MSAPTGKEQRQVLAELVGAAYQGASGLGPMQRFVANQAIRAVEKLLVGILDRLDNIEGKKNA